MKTMEKGRATKRWKELGGRRKEEGGRRKEEVFFFCWGFLIELCTLVNEIV